MSVGPWWNVKFLVFQNWKWLGHWQRAILVDVYQRQIEGEGRPVAWKNRVPSRSESAAKSRALRQLARKRLIVRIGASSRNRTTTVQLTDEGKAVAKELTKWAEKHVNQ